MLATTGQNTNQLFICSYDQTEFQPAKASGILYAGDTDNFVKMCNDVASQDYVFNMTGTSTFKVIIPFASATCSAFGNQTRIVQDQGLPSRPFGSYNLVGPSKMQISLQYDRISINGTDRFGKGQHKICIEKVGRQGINALVSVTLC